MFDTGSPESKHLHFMNKLRKHPGQSWGYQQRPHIWCGRGHLHDTYHNASRHQSQIPISNLKKQSSLNSSDLSTFQQKATFKKYQAPSAPSAKHLPFVPCLRSHGTRPGKCPLPVAGPRRPRVCGVGPWGSMLCGGTAPWNGPATGEAWRPSWTWSLATKRETTMILQGYDII